MVKTKVAVFVSGQGSNAIKLMEYFKGHQLIEVAALVANNAHSPALDKARELGLTVHVFSNQSIAEGVEVVEVMQSLSIDFIVLAGFLRKLPLQLIQHFDQRIINIHPSLLPKHGGKGMFGDHVHAAVLANGDQETGITIHIVNEEFDKGQRLAQYFVSIAGINSVEGVRQEVRKLEHRYFAPLIEQYILSTR